MGLRWDVLLLDIAGSICSVADICNGGRTRNFVRNNDYSLDMPIDIEVFQVPLGYSAPQQVHITHGDRKGRGVIVSWVTPDEPGSNTVLYWAENSKVRKQEDGIVLTYKFFNYASGYIHLCTILDLEMYCSRYEILAWSQSMNLVCEAGVLGQTYSSNSTLTHYELNPKRGQTVLFIKDLSYADEYPFHDNTRSRYHVPYELAKSSSPLWYSIKRASARIIVLSSYSAFDKYTPQYKWLEKGFGRVKREKTPWLIVLMRSPLYSSYAHHHIEGEAMRVVYERLFVKNKVDVVFAGHVHAYERSERISNIAYNVVNGLCTPIHDQSAPVYITIGDGGNLEGLTKS